MRAHRLQALAGLLVAAFLLTPAQAQAGHDITAEATFWAFSQDTKFFLVHIEDENRGTVLAVKKVGKQASIYEAVAGGMPVESMVRTPPLSNYRFVDPGVKGPDSPDAKVKLLTSPTPTHMQVFMTNGQDMVPLFSLPLRRSEQTGEYAKAQVKEFVWNSTGHSAVLMLHQELGGPYGMSVDQIVSFPTISYRKKLAAKAKRSKAAAKKK